MIRKLLELRGLRLNNEKNACDEEEHKHGSEQFPKVQRCHFTKQKVYVKVSNARFSFHGKVASFCIRKLHNFVALGSCDTHYINVVPLGSCDVLESFLKTDFHLILFADCSRMMDF